jgi:hypothetical protein
MFKGAEPALAPKVKRLETAADHGGFGLKAALSQSLRAAGYEIEDYGAYELDSADDYPDFIIPLARAVALWQRSRRICRREQDPWCAHRADARCVLRPPGRRRR